MTTAHPTKTSVPAHLSIEGRLACFLMSVPRNVAKTVISYSSPNQVRAMAVARKDLPGLTSEDCRQVQMSAAKAMGVDDSQLSVVFFNRPRWAVSVLGFWAARGSYLGRYGN
jgi:hypothetical protein